MHLAACQQHRRTALAEGGVPGTLSHDTFLHNEPGKVVRAAVGEVQLSGTLLHEIARSADGSLQREGAARLGDADSGGVGDGYLAVGTHIVF